NALTDTGAGTGLTGDLRYCINQSNDDPGPDTITFAASLTQSGPVTINLSNTLYLTNHNGTTIQGPGANLLTIDGGNASGVFSVSSGASAVLDGLNIIRGSATFGAGIANYGNSLTVSNSVLYGNFATTAGGAIYNFSGTVTVSNSILTGNSATSDPNGG